MSSLSLEHSMASPAESSAPWYRRKTSVSNMAFFHRSGMQCIKRGGFVRNIVPASVKLGGIECIIVEGEGEDRGNSAEEELPSGD